MKNCLANKQILNIFLLITLAAFLVLPKICLADDSENIKLEELSKYLELPEKDTNRLMDSLRQVFTTEGILAWSSGDATEEKIAVAVTLLKVVTIQALSHLLVDAPLEIAQKIIKSAIEVARLYLSDDISVILEKFEKESVQKAVEYGIDALLQNEIRVTPGAIKFKYYSYKGGEKEITLQYVMIYKPESEKRAQVVIRFYMPDSIEAPVPQKYGSITSLYVPDLRKDLFPFIVEINGTVKKDEFDNYLWINEIGDASHPSVNITFPPTVPDLGIKPLTLWEKYVLKPIESKIKEVEIIITKVTGKSLNLVEIWDKAKSFFSELNPFGPAAIVQTLAPSAPAQLTQPTTSPILEKPLEKLTEPLTEVRPLSTPSSASSATPKPSVIKPLTLAEIQEQLDDIAEKIDVLNQKVAKFAAAQGITPKVAGATDEFAGGPIPEELEEEIPLTPSPQVTFPPYIPAGSPPRTTLPQILITEVASGWDKSDNEFIEIYNPNDFQVTLSSQNFQLKLVNSNNIVTEKRIDLNRYVIPSKSYFLFVAGEIKKEGTTITPDATYADQLTGVSGVIVMDCEENIKDRVSWGKPEKQPPFEATEWSGVILDQGLKTGESLERKKDANGDYIDTDDNSQDFQISPNPNPTNSQGITLYYDSTFPETSLDENSLPTNPTFSTEANFIFTSNEENSTFECSLDGEDFQPCQSPKNYTNLGVGSHQFQVRAIDPFGNIDQVPVSYSWTIENLLNLLITEVQIEGNKTSYDFIEIYNPNNFDVYLEDYRLIKRTQGGSQDTSIKSWSQEPTEKISANNYYLWARYETGDENFAISVNADAKTQVGLTDNNSIALRLGAEDTGQIIDALGWGDFNNLLFETTGFSQNPGKNQSIERKKNADGNYTDTNDNSQDFFLQVNPNPKGQSLDLTGPSCETNIANADWLNSIFTVNWQSPDSDVAFYDVQIKIGMEDWQNWFENTTQTQADYIASEIDFYFFRTRATDKVRNQGDWSGEAIVEPPPPIPMM